MTPAWFSRVVTLGDTGSDVRVIQRRLGLDATGVFDEGTQAVVRGKQKKHKLPTTGEVDADTASAIGERATEGLKPEWWCRDINLWMVGPDVAACNTLLGHPREGDTYTPEVESATKRLQSEHGIDTTGVVDEQTAKIMGDI